MWAIEKYYLNVVRVNFSIIHIIMHDYSVRHTCSTATDSGTTDKNAGTSEYMQMKAAVEGPLNSYSAGHVTNCAWNSIFRSFILAGTGTPVQIYSCSPLSREYSIPKKRDNNSGKKQ